MAKILVVDDEQVMRAFLERALRKLGYEVEVASNEQEALELFVPRRFQLVLSDLRMPGSSGLDLLASLLDRDPRIGVVIMTAFGTIENAVEAVQRGAVDFLTKPIELAHLRLVLEKALKASHTQQELERLRPHADTREQLGMLVGRSLAMKRVYNLIDRVAARDLTVLILGETGTGKSLCAKALHQLGERSQGRFQTVDCTALQETLLESELFGHEKGSFTGAHERKRGHFEVANGGTIFLDEIGDAPLAVQAKLLRAIHEREIVRVGGTDPIKVDVRVVAATNCNLEEMVAAGTFRQDLYYRLSPFPIEIAPLRNRIEDLPLLVEHILADVGVPELELAPEAALALEACQWPGNVRQLQNVITRASVLADDGLIELAHLEGVLPELSSASGEDAGDDARRELPVSPKILDLSLREARRHFECFYLERALRVAQGNVSETARRVGMGRASLHDKLNKLGIDPAKFRI
ncbi:MAG: sigma-54-dependent Fis family transcriptional regulator [Planctomycetes bacterium]|nr:sigma-54-dependent Fis family transcriptional regulator [Planctomycetota bacterium]